MKLRPKHKTLLSRWMAILVLASAPAATASEISTIDALIVTFRKKPHSAILAKLDRQAKTAADVSHEARWLLRLRVLEDAFSKLDPTFDGNKTDMGTLNVGMKWEVDGKTYFYDSGVDPKHIADPAARAAYEKAIQENQRKVERANLQFEIRKCANGFVTDLEFVSRADHSIFSDSLKAAIQSAKLDDATRKRLNEVIMKAP